MACPYPPGAVRVVRLARERVCGLFLVSFEMGGGMLDSDLS
jgi:hypothetical protein